jgi:hypothetical protein
MDCAANFKVGLIRRGRGESLGPTSTSTDQQTFSPLSRTLPKPSPSGSPPDQFGLKAIDPKLKPNYPDAMEPTRDSFELKEIPLETPKMTTPKAQAAPASNIPSQGTVKPLEIFRPPLESRKNPSILENILAPEHVPTVAKESEQPSFPAAAHPSKESAQGKAERKTNTISLQKASIIEEVVTALMKKAKSSEKAIGHTYGEKSRNCLPSSRSSSGGNPGMTSLTDPQCNINPDSPAGEQDRTSQKKTTAEFLQTLHDLGYILQKDPSLPLKPQKPGSVASIKSENLATCDMCKKFKGRPCELK